MKRLVKMSAMLVVASVALSSCNSYSSMSKDLGDVDLNCTPETLVLNNGTVTADITVTYPADYFNSKAVARVTPVLVFDGGEVACAPFYYQGSKVDNNYTVVSDEGGSFTERIQFAYSDEMRSSELQLRIEFEEKDGFTLINANTGEMVSNDEADILAAGASAEASAISRACGLTIADGINTLQSDINYADVMDAMANDYKAVLTTVTKADLNYGINSSRLDSKKMSSSEVEAFKALVESNSQNDRATQSIYANGYASPDGPEKFNDKLSKARSESAKKAMDKILADYGVEIDLAAYGEDWDGFKELVQESDIQDKNLILQVLSLYDSSTQREAEIKNLASVFAELKDDVLPALRRAQMLNSTDLQGKTDDEMMVLVNAGNYSELTLEELLHMAEIVEDDATKVKVLAYAAKEYNDARAYNNLGVALAATGDAEASLEAFEQAARKGDSSATLNQNLALANLNNGKVAEAKKYTLSDADAKSAMAAAEGNYSSASALEGYNAAIVNVMNNNYSAAKSSIADDKSADADYLRAVIASLEGNTSTAGAELKSAVAKDSSLAEKATTDVNLSNLFESGFSL